MIAPKIVMTNRTACAKCGYVLTVPEGSSVGWGLCSSCAVVLKAERTPCYCESRDCTCTPEIVKAVETIYTPPGIAPTVICAYCKAVMETGTPYEGRVSHGVCRSCVPKVRAEAGLPPLPAEPSYRAKVESMAVVDLIEEVLRLTEELNKPIHDENECHVCQTIKAKRQ